MSGVSTSYNEILRRLEAVGTRELRLRVLYGTLATLLIAFAAIFAVTLLEEVFTFGVIGRTILFAAALAVVAAAAAWLLVRPLLARSQDHHALAEKVGSHFPQVRDRLLDAMQVYENKDALTGHYSLPLIDASFSDLYTNAQPLNFTDAVSDMRVRKIRKTVLYAAALILLVFVIPQLGMFDSFYRVINFGTSFAASMPLQLTRQH